MSFTCQQCKTAQKPGEKPFLVTTKVRRVTYLHSQSKTGSGTEIVQEMMVCERCRLLNYLPAYEFEPEVIEGLKYVEVKELRPKKKQRQDSRGAA